MGSSSSKPSSSLPNDLPPQKNVEELTDKEFISTFEVLQSMSPCTAIGNYMSQLSAKELSNTTDENGVNYPATYNLVCVLGYMDRDFYNCLSQEKISFPQDLYKEVAYIDSIKNQQVTSSQMQNPVVRAGNICGELRSSAIDTLQNRASYMENTSNLTDAFEPYNVMVQQATDYVLPEDSEEVAMNKMQRIQATACPPPTFTEADVNVNNIVSAGLAGIEHGNCLVSHFCADYIRKCLQDPSQNYATCINRPEVLACMEKLPNKQ